MTAPLIPTPALAEQIRALAIPHDLTDEGVTGYLMARRDAAALADTAATTLRDWFAGQALSGLCATSGASAVDVAWFEQVGAKWVYGIADAMISARVARK